MSNYFVLNFLKWKLIEKKLKKHHQYSLFGMR